MPDTRDDANTIERTLHQRLLDGDPLATSDLFHHLAPILLRRLTAKYPTTDRDLVHDAIVDALLGYFNRPDRFDPARRSLRGYLFMAAEGDLRNLLEREQRRRSKLAPAEPVELDARARKEWAEGGDIADRIADEEIAGVMRDEAMVVARTDEERVVMRLRLDGERSTAAYAAALGWTGLTAAERRRRLYQIKDRLDQRLRRRGERDG